MSLKVVFVGQFTVYGKNISFYNPGTDGFFQFGMGQFIAEEFISRDYPATFEIWRMDYRIDKVMEKEIGGILCRIFPSKKCNFLGRNFGEFSKEMRKAFKLENKIKNVAFHFMPNHTLAFHLYARIVSNKTIISTHLGGANPYWKFKKMHNWISIFGYYLEKYWLLKPYNHFITICKQEADYYTLVNKPATHMPVFGLSREKQLVIRDRKESRKKLGLPLDKKILLQVGRAYKMRGFDWILDIIDHYQKKDDYFLVFAGINENDQYYQPLKNRGVFMTPSLYHADLVDFFNAADLLFFLINSVSDLAFGGTGYVPLEALACGTPVVATTFHHFPSREVQEVSRIPECKEDVIPMMEDLLAANVSRERCREIVLRHFSWDKVIEKHWQLYNNCQFDA